MQFVTNFSASDLVGQCREVLFFDPTLDTSTNLKSDKLIANLDSVMRDCRAALGFNNAANPVRGVASDLKTYHLTSLRYAQGSETYASLRSIFHNSVAWGKSPFASVAPNYPYNDTAGPTPVLWPTTLDAISTQELVSPKYGIKNSTFLNLWAGTVSVTFNGWLAYNDGTFSTKGTYTKSYPGLTLLLSDYSVSPAMTVANTKKVDYIAAPYTCSVAPTNFVPNPAYAVSGQFSCNLATVRTAEKVTLQYGLGYAADSNVYIRLARGTDYNVAASVEPGTRPNITFLKGQQKITL
ncbi:hypothetical protein pEaSNUABM5_00196 [Erwinia phage pEa_SNUABM_5]|uniref:Uncharacterized protein n=1 Tax=Erwinia phage pEa_SNUABM_5 TaxID=2797313 RepID=A0A7T8EPL3_9CAUD|nr:hypothetical protein MPK73_gp196 [Erwinia phage pEa_SNUABM_5]QQO90338.1 hypothetical protein pEaSNUABM5_00196 [Erwinia phage pEa_SNUABM_5]